MVAFFADANRARMRFIKELDTAWGVTPASGVARELRFTGSTLEAQKATAISAEIRADRMVPDVIATGFTANGNVNVEFSAGSHDDLMEGFMYGAWTRPMTFDNVKGDSLQWFSNAVLYVKGKDVSNYFTSGHRIRTTGFVDPHNNNYFQMSSVVWNAGANRTEITVSTTTCVAESGSHYTALYDANDVIVLRDTHIRSGTAGASAFDSNGNNSFAAGIAAGQFTAGQKIFVEGLGYETGTITVADPAGAAVAAGATLTVSDGKLSATLQFGGVLVPGNIAVVADGASATVTAANIVAAINGLRPSGLLSMAATNALGVVTLKNLNQTGGSITKLGDTNTSFAIVAFSGGNTSVRGIFTIQSAVDDVLTVTPAPATLANTTIAVTVKGSMLRNPHSGNIVPHSFTFETAFEDINQFFVSDGQRVSTMDYNFAAGSILTGSFGLMGHEVLRNNTTKLGAAPYTVLATTATPVANATSNVGSITLNGSALSTALKTISVKAANNLRDQQAVGNKFPVGIGAGRMDISGSVEAYFSDGNLWDKFLNHTTVSLGWFVEDVDLQHYEFSVPTVVFSTDKADPSGGNSDVMETMDWVAKRDPITDCMIQIDRFSTLQPISASA